MHPMYVFRLKLYPESLRYETLEGLMVISEMLEGVMVGDEPSGPHHNERTRRRTQAELS